MVPECRTLGVYLLIDGILKSSLVYQLSQTHTKHRHIY